MREGEASLNNAEALKKAERSEAERSKAYPSLKPKNFNDREKSTEKGIREENFVDEYNPI